MSRARGRWMWTGAIALLGMAASCLLVCLTYELEHGDSWNVGEGAVFEEATRNVAVHELRPGIAVQIAVTVRNPGPLPIALDEVALNSPDVAVDAVTMLEHAGQSAECCRPEDATAFRPVTVGPNDQIMIWLALRVTGVSPYPPCSGFAVETADLRYHVLRFPRTQSLPLRTDIAFRTPCS
ncbi:hypothetical protein AB0B31_05830 [Catellatospora citrea]|uniref:hypothetical protein n=1 Tax=Catellatospora citrea TaxID=53366 RepID=UPI003411D6DE